MKYKVDIARVEYYNYAFEVDAESEQEAREIASELMNTCDVNDGDLVNAEEFVNGVKEISQ